MSTTPDLYLEERRRAIAARIVERGRVTVAELSERFGVSEVTIRSDLQVLADQKLLVRTHGGAVSPGSGASEMAFALRREHKVREKRRIGRVGADLVANGDAIYLDSSSTSLSIAHYLKPRRHLSIITNSMAIIQELLDAPHIDVIATGGSFERETAAFVGSYSEALLERVHIQKGFFGAHGIGLATGLTDISAEIAAAKRPVLIHCQQSIAVVDASKWGRVGIAKFADVAEMNVVITDDAAPATEVLAVRQAGVDIRVV